MGIQTQICGLFLLLTILLLRVLQPQTLRTRTRQLYTRLLFCAIACLFLDGFSVLVIRWAQGSYGLYEHIICRGYLISLDLVSAMSFLYLTMGLQEHLSYISVLRKLCYILCVAYAAAIVMLPIGFFHEGDRVYTFGPSVLTTYASAATSIFANIGVLLRCRKYMDRRKWLAGMLWMVIWVVSACIQITHEDLLLVGFAMALGVTIVFIQLETPDYQKLNDTLEQLEQSRREALEASQAKSSFLAQMSHEIRTPINAVLGMNEMILRESHEEPVLEYASNAYNAGRALLSVINDILDISKIEAGKLEIVEAEYDLYSLVNDCFHMTEERARKKGLSFSYTVDEAMPSKLLGDMFHIRQVAVNFLTNAVKYTDQGSVELSFSGEGDGDGYALQIAVKDTGIGLTEESLSTLFDSFQRFDLERNQGVEGTGLGLTICKQLTELMGGRLDVESEYGKGSTFRCTIPQKIVDGSPVGRIDLDRPAERPAAERGRVFKAPEARILVVDDVEMNLLVFTSLLKGHDLQIDAVTSGKQCLGMVADVKYDVIFMDHMMPEMDGMETFARMKETEHLNRGTPVVMLTANAISGEKEKYLAAGFSSYLTKPIQSGRLEELLLQYLPEEKVTWETAGQDAPAPAPAAAPSGDGLFDPALGLQYAGNDPDTYRAVLSSYVRNGPDRLSKIRGLCEREQWKDYTTEVHALKSTSLTIGARDLSELAAGLEKAGRAGDGDTIREKTGELLELYQRVLDLGGQELGPEEAPQSGGDAPKREIGAEELRGCADRIAGAVDSFDGDAVIEVCGELSGCTFRGTDLGEALRPVREAAEDFEYDKAGALAAECFAGLLG